MTFTGLYPKKECTKIEYLARGAFNTIMKANINESSFMIRKKDREQLLCLMEIAILGKKE